MVRKVADLWLIVGPTGLFVVGQAGSDPLGDARRAVDMAQRLRELLSLRMAWVPFVDALLIGGRPSDEPACPIVRPSMLESVLLDGRSRIELSTMFEVRRYLPGIAQELATS